MQADICNQATNFKTSKGIALVNITFNERFNKFNMPSGNEDPKKPSPDKHEETPEVRNNSTIMLKYWQKVFLAVFLAENLQRKLHEVKMEMGLLQATPKRKLRTRYRSIFEQYFRLSERSRSLRIQLENQRRSVSFAAHRLDRALRNQIEWIKFSEIGLARALRSQTAMLMRFRDQVEPAIIRDREYLLRIHREIQSLNQRRNVLFAANRLQEVLEIRRERSFIFEGQLAELIRDRREIVRFTESRLERVLGNRSAVLTFLEDGQLNIIRNQRDMFMFSGDRLLQNITNQRETLAFAERRLQEALEQRLFVVRYEVLLARAYREQMQSIIIAEGRLEQARINHRQTVISSSLKKDTNGETSTINSEDTSQTIHSSNASSDERSPMKSVDSHNVENDIEVEELKNKMDPYSKEIIHTSRDPPNDIELARGFPVTKSSEVYNGSGVEIIEPNILPNVPMQVEIEEPGVRERTDNAPAISQRVLPIVEHYLHPESDERIEVPQEVAAEVVIGPGYEEAVPISGQYVRETFGRDIHMESEEEY